jgi:hypothetical protein
LRASAWLDDPERASTILAKRSRGNFWQGFNLSKVAAGLEQNEHDYTQLHHLGVVMLRSITGAQNAFYAIPSYTVSPMSPVIVRVASAAGVQPTAKAAAKPRVKGKARPEAQPYQEGNAKTFSLRTQRKGHGIYLSGYATEDDVMEAARKRRTQIDKLGAPKGLGPDMTTAAQALRDYAMARLRFKKGARQEAVRINNYLRMARLDTLLVAPLEAVTRVVPGTPEAATPSDKASSKAKKRSTVYFSVTLAPFQSERVIPNGLHVRRKAQLTKTSGSQKHRAILAQKKLGDIRRDDMQNYMNAMRDEDVAPATMKLEQSLWKVLFNYAFTTWGWASLKDNPATRLEMPAVENERKRMMSHAEQTLLDAAFLDCRNALVAPVVTLLRETASLALHDRGAHWLRLARESAGVCACKTSLAMCSLGSSLLRKPLING